MQLFSAPRVLTAAFAALTVLLSVSLSAMAQMDETKLAPEKKTKLELYLDAKSTPDFLKKNTGRVLFVDVRTRTEAMFVGMPSPTFAILTSHFLLAARPSRANAVLAFLFHFEYAT